MAVRIWAMVRRHGSIENALKHEPMDILPRGELFIDKPFLDAFFDQAIGDYLGQLAAAASALGLALVGVDLNGPEVCHRLSRKEFVKLEAFFCAACINGPVSNLVTRLGFKKAMIALRGDAVLFKEAAASTVTELKEMVGQISDSGFKAIAITDDIAGNSGLWFSPQTFQNVVRPYYGTLVQVIKSRGLFAFFHSDGDTWAILKTLIEAGFDCLHPVDAQAGMNLYDLKESLGSTTCFMGHIDIMGWSPERIRQEGVKAGLAGRQGGIILGSSCGLSVEAAREGLSALYPEWRYRRGAT